MKRSPSSVTSTSSVLGACRLSRFSMKSQSRTELRNCKDSQQMCLVTANRNAKAESLRLPLASLWPTPRQRPGVAPAIPTGGQSPYPHGAFGAELFPRFLRLCQPPVRVSMTVKAFASKWTGPSALLKVFTSFFPEKQKRICQNLGADEPLLCHSC